MQNETDKKWIKWILLGIIIGFFVGKLISMILGLFLNTAIWNLLIAACIPSSIVLALIIVLAAYQKSKEKILE